jgi:hypothetical protein
MSKPKGKPKSQFIKKWVWIKTVWSDEEYYKVKFLKIYSECGEWAVDVQHENGKIEPIFLSTINRITPVKQKEAKVIDMRKRLKLIKSG